MSDLIKTNVCSIIKNLDANIHLYTKSQLEQLFDRIRLLYTDQYNEDDNIDDILDELFVIKYTFQEPILDNTDKNIVEKYIDSCSSPEIITDNNIEIPKFSNFELDEIRDKYYEDNVNKMRPYLNDDLKTKHDHYQFLWNLPQPAQKTPEWYDQRNNVITASSGSNALGESKYGTRDEYIMEKIGEGPGFKENEFVYHGKKYEKIATKIYEHLYNSKIGEFGLVLYQNDKSDTEPVDFIGASPDGIGMTTTLDGKPNKWANYMLEIKCPFKRQISITGVVDGEICPHYYWVQCQLQMAACKCQYCHFWQCNIVEMLKDEWDAIADTYNSCVFTVEQGQKTPIEKMLTRGFVIQLFPVSRDNIPKYDRSEWYAKHIYPSNLLMTKDEYYEWYEYMKANWRTLYPDWAKDYKFMGARYWRLANCHNVTIERDIKWFNTKLPLFKAFWNDVLLYRNNDDKKALFIKEYNDKKAKNMERAAKAKATREKNKALSSTYTTETVTSTYNASPAISMKSTNATTSVFRKSQPMSVNHILNEEDMFLSES